MQLAAKTLTMFDPPLPLQIAFARQSQRIEAIACTLNAAKAKAIAAVLSGQLFDHWPAKAADNAT